MLVTLLLPLGGCSSWLFSGIPQVDRSRPVALVETTGGIEFGATTEFGILTLGRSATEGPCRVHLFLGPTPLIEDGSLAGTGSVFTRAQIGLHTQSVRALERSPGPEDELIAMWTPNGTATETLSVELTTDAGVTGDVLANPGTRLPPGAAIFAEASHGLLFVGLVSGRATIDGPNGRRSYYTFSGVDRIRELLTVPELYPYDYQTVFRPDDITVSKPVK